MTDFDYRKYSLEQLENWMHDAMSCGEATPQEIYDVIVGAVKDNYYTYKHQASQAYELLALLNNNPFADEVKEVGKLWDKEDVNAILNEREYYDGWDSPCEMSGTGAIQYTEEELNAMCDKAASDEEKEKCREYNLREAEYYNKRAELDAKQEKSKYYWDVDRNRDVSKLSYDEAIASGWTMTDDGFWIKETSETVTSGASVSPKEDKVTKWILPVQVDGLTGECFVEFPDDLLERAGLKEGDTVEWIAKDDGTIEMRKVTKNLKMDKC